MFIKQHIFHLNFIAAENFDAIVEDMLNYPTLPNELPVVITPNVDLTVHLNKQPDLLQKFQHARFILPDGFPIILFSKALNKPLGKRLAGSDLFPVIWKKSIALNKKVLLIVPNEAIKSKLQQEYPNAQFYIPPFFEANEDNIEEECSKIFPLIAQQQPDFVFIGLRYPKQEMIALNLYEKTKNSTIGMPLFFNLGASYEFYTGIKKRAPLWIQKIGMEWLHRFLNEPIRTFKRYFWDDLYIFILFLKELINR
jgi:N-acetylglucosaminyldiphosphoundecaprenol N-acetyl-beta-D-mannosaminyltransferase